MWESKIGCCPACNRRFLCIVAKLGPPSCESRPITGHSSSVFYFSELSEQVAASTLPASIRSFEASEGVLDNGRRQRDANWHFRNSIEPDGSGTASQNDHR
jgi:hypothetical protein